MRIHEVCEITGLTQKTIRFYEQKELITPSIEYKNDRAFRDYTAEDVAELTMVASLRKAMFSIEQIKIMMDSPKSVPAIMKLYQETVNENAEKLTQLKNTVNSIDADKLGNVYHLSHALEAATKSLTLPKADITPHFRYLDDKYNEKIEVPATKNRVFTRAFIIYLVVVLAVTGFALFVFYYHSTTFVIQDDLYKLADYSNDKNAGIGSYTFVAGGGWKKGGTTIRVNQTPGEYSRPGRKGSEVFSNHEVIVQRNSSEELVYKYEAKTSYDFTHYKSIPFPFFTVTKPDSSVEDINGDTVTGGQLQEQSSEDVQMVLDCILAIRDHVPFTRGLVLTLIFAAAAVALVLGAKYVLTNILGITSGHPKKKLYGTVLFNGFMTPIDNDKRYIDGYEEDE